MEAGGSEWRVSVAHPAQWSPKARRFRYLSLMPTAGSRETGRTSAVLQYCVYDYVIRNRTMCLGPRGGPAASSML